jgi:hypothetical protein
MAREMKQAVSDKVGGQRHLIQPEPLSNPDITVYGVLRLRLCHRIH